MNFADMARHCARPIRGCATDEQYVEVLDRIIQALSNLRDTAACLAGNACLVPPDGGAPSEEEQSVATSAAEAILRLGED
jgi:hypothetical protein